MQRGSLKRLYDRNGQISLPAEAPRRGERPAAVKKCLTKSGGADGGGGVDGDGSGRGRVGGSLARQVYLSSPSPHASFCEDLPLAARVRVTSRLPLNDSHFGPRPSRTCSCCGEAARSDGEVGSGRGFAPAVRLTRLCPAEPKRRAGMGKGG